MDQEQSPLLQVKSTVHHLYLYISTTTFVAKNSHTKDTFHLSDLVWREEKVVAPNIINVPQSSEI